MSTTGLIKRRQEVIKYLNEENDYRNEYMKDYKPLEEEIFQEIKSRIRRRQLCSILRE